MTNTPSAIEPVELRAGELLLRRWREDDADAYWTALESPCGRLWHGSTLATWDDVVAMLARRSDWTTGDHASWALVNGTDLLGSISLLLEPFTCLVPDRARPLPAVRENVTVKQPGQSS